MNRTIQPSPAIIHEMAKGNLIARTLEEARERKIFKAVIGKTWHNEPFQIPFLNNIHIDLEREGSFLFGIVTFDARCTGYVWAKPTEDLGSKAYTYRTNVWWNAC